MWTYNQLTGAFTHNGESIATGYSGFEAGKNNPAMQGEANVGPIPKGRYSIGERFDSETHGPIVMRLTPAEGTDTFGRSGFLIHGDSLRNPGEASHGCLILPRPVRIAIAQSADKSLEVG